MVSRVRGQEPAYYPADHTQLEPENVSLQDERHRPSENRLHEGIRSLFPGLSRKLDTGDLILILILVFLYLEHGEEEELLLALAFLLLL